MATLRSLSLMTALTATLAAAACSQPSAPQTGGDQNILEGGGGPRLCAALRGNGNYVITHFASLARLIESYGLMDGMAGGSSSTITMFTYESILKNPALRDCDGHACSADETAGRAALLLKSVEEYGVAVGTSDGILGEGGILEIIQNTKAQGVEGLLKIDPVKAAEKLRAILSPEEAARLRVLVNPEITAMLKVTDPKLLAYNVNEVHESLQTFGKFSVANNRLFFRPGLVDFNGAAGSTFARAGDFYAGYGPSDRASMKHFLDACAAPSKGLLWIDKASPEKGIDHLAIDGTSCSKYFSAQVTTFFSALDEAPAFASRVDEKIGATLNALAATSVVTGAGIDAYARGLAAYRDGSFPSPAQIPFDVKFDDVRFGYWGSSASLDRVLANAKGYTDLKTKKATSLGTGTWREILSHSPAEPGLARLGALPDGRLSAGGWPDLAPVLALKNLGCDKVVYVTRRQPESSFATGIANQLGMKDEERQLYDLGNLESSFSKSLSEANGVWCTDWNSFTNFQIDEMAGDSYRAPLETRDPFFAGKYSNIVASTQQAGCTPGVK